MIRTISSALTRELLNKKKLKYGNKAFPASPEATITSGVPGTVSGAALTGAHMHSFGHIRSSAHAFFDSSAKSIHHLIVHAGKSVECPT